jgi:hypothetical protein
MGNLSIKSSLPPDDILYNAGVLQAHPGSRLMPDEHWGIRNTTIAREKNKGKLMSFF